MEESGPRSCSTTRLTDPAAAQGADDGCDHTRARRPLRADEHAGGGGREPPDLVVGRPTVAAQLSESTWMAGRVSHGAHGDVLKVGPLDVQCTASGTRDARTDPHTWATWWPGGCSTRRRIHGARRTRGHAARRSNAHWLKSLERSPTRASAQRGHFPSRRAGQQIGMGWCDKRARRGLEATGREYRRLPVGERVEL